MARYAQLTDCTDPSITVTETHLDAADVYVDSELWARGINPVGVALPNATLTKLAATWAIQLASVEGAITDNSPLIDKAKQYRIIAEAIAKGITRESLGLTITAGSGFGNVRIGRG